MHKRTITAALISASTLVAGVLVAAPGAQARPAPKAVPHTKPAWLGHAQHLGHADAKSGVNARVYLAPNGGTNALKAAVAAVSTPGSASYKHFLSPTQYQAQYGTTDATVHQVPSWLTSNGLKVTGVESHNRYVSISGTVAAAQKAFGSSIDRYRHDGQTVQAPTSDLTVPGSVAGSVLTVTGLDTTPQRNAPNNQADAPPPAGFRNARPCSIYYGQVQAKYQADFKTPLPKFDGKTLPYAPCGYTGPQFRAAYEGNDGPRRQRRDRRDHRRVRRADDRAGRQEVRRTTTATAATPPASSPRRSHARSTARPTAARRAGTARRPSTSRPCTRWRPARTSATTPSAELLRRRLPRHAGQGRRRGPGCSSCPTRGATSRRTRAPTTSRRTSRSSCRARCRASASCSPPATTATSWPTPASSRPTTRPPTRT